MCYKGSYQHSNWKQHQGHYARKQWFKEQMKQKMQQHFYPPVNVAELDDRYEVNIYAAGYAKEDFEVKLKDNTLVLRAKKESEAPKGNGQFQPSSFERRFELNEKINKELIVAEYENGVLQITLPKLTEFETFQQEIEIK